MDTQQFNGLTSEQREALFKLWTRFYGDSEPVSHFATFVDSAVKDTLMGCVMVKVPSIRTWFGIEPDGYTHT